PPCATGSTWVCSVGRSIGGSITVTAWRRAGARTTLVAAVLLGGTLGLMIARAHAGTTPLIGGVTFTGTSGTLDPSGQTYDASTTAVWAASRASIPVVPDMDDVVLPTATLDTDDADHRLAARYAARGRAVIPSRPRALRGRAEARHDLP